MKYFSYGSSASFLAWGFPCFLLPIILISYRFPPICPVWRMASSFCAASCRLYLSAPGDLFLGLHFKVSFGFLVLIPLLYVKATVIFQRMCKLPVILFIQSVPCFILSYSPDTIILNWSKCSQNDFSFKGTYLFCARLGKHPYGNPT